MWVEDNQFQCKSRDPSLKGIVLVSEAIGVSERKVVGGVITLQAACY